MIELKIECEIPDLSVALVELCDIKVEPTPEDMIAHIRNVVEVVAKEGIPGGELRRQAIRDLLRSGGFKPSGRSKPAQEYLLRSIIQDGHLPSVSNAVDLLNLLSIQSGIPISLASLQRLGSRLSLRYGQDNENFVFNRVGQELSLKGLICLCTLKNGHSEPVATPVKDSMIAKIDEQDHQMLACFYATHRAIPRSELSNWAEQMGIYATRWCSASSFKVTLLP